MRSDRSVTGALVPWCAVLLAALALAGCGGARRTPDDEVTARWSEGDDAPLEESDALSTHDPHR